MENILQCQLTESCAGVICCVDFTIDIPLSSQTKDVSFATWLEVDPCEFQVDVGIATFQFKQQMLHYEWGKQLTIRDC